MIKIKRVTKKESRIARTRAIAIIGDVRKELKSKYRFADKLVGSAKYNTILRDNNGKYDLDYNLQITKNSKNYGDSPTAIKNDFFQAFVNCKSENEELENSTTAITLRFFDGGKEIFSYDFVVIKSEDDSRLVIRRNGPNQYTWNELPSKYNDTYAKFNSLSSEDRRILIEEKILPRKAKEKLKYEDLQRPSVEIFIEEINNFKVN